MSAVAVAAMILPPSHFPGVAAEIRPRNVMVMAEFGTPDAAETALGLVYAGIIARIAG